MIGPNQKKSTETGGEVDVDANDKECMTVPVEHAVWKNDVVRFSFSFFNFILGRS